MLRIRVTRRTWMQARKRLPSYIVLYTTAHGREPGRQPLQYGAGDFDLPGGLHFNGWKDGQGLVGLEG